MLHCNSISLGYVFIGILLLGFPSSLDVPSPRKTPVLLAPMSHMSQQPQVQRDRRNPDDCIWDFVHLCLGCYCSYLCMSPLHECRMLQKCCCSWNLIPGGDHWSSVYMVDILSGLFPSEHSKLVGSSLEGNFAKTIWNQFVPATFYSPGICTSNYVFADYDRKVVHDRLSCAGIQYSLAAIFQDCGTYMYNSSCKFVVRIPSLILHHELVLLIQIPHILQVQISQVFEDTHNNFFILVSEQQPHKSVPLCKAILCNC